MELARLVGRKVLVRRESEVEQTQSGLFLPSEARERPNIGRVVAVGSYRGGAPLPLAKGDLVLFPKMHDRVVWINGEELLYFNHNELEAVIE